MLFIIGVVAHCGLEIISACKLGLHRTNRIRLERLATLYRDW